jgi:hypothetical protein
VRFADTRSVARRLLVLPLLASLFFLPGCFWWLAPVAAFEGAGESSSSAPEEMAQANIRASIPAIEAYYADNGTYKGATVEALQSYDAAIQGIEIVRANDQTYCIQSTTGGMPWYKAGPASDIVPGDCSMPAPLTPPTPPQYDPQTNVRAAIPAIEAYYADHNTYAGMTDDLLRRYDPFMPSVTLVRANAKGYCVESTVDGVTFHKAGPQGDVAPGHCS